MFAKMKKTVINVKGEKFDKGEIVEVKDVWLNRAIDKIYINVKLNDKLLITSIIDVEIEK